MKRFPLFIGFKIHRIHKLTTQEKHLMKQSFILSLLFTLLLSNAGNSQTLQKLKAPNFALQTYDGKVIELATLKGKVVMINFWATWCPPCQAEIPDFIEVYKTYKSKGFEIIGIAMDEDGWSAVKPFMDTSKINYPIVLGTMEVVQQYGGIKGFPTTFIVDKDGYLAGMQVGMLSKEALEQKVNSLLSVPLPINKKAPLKPMITAQHVNVEVKLSANKIQAGSSAQVALQLKIDKDWHINSHTPTFNYLIGTTFELQSKEGIILADVQFPKGNLVSLSIADQPIDVYEGTTTIFASLRFSDKLNLGSDTIKGSVTFQACNDQICLPPSTINVNIPIQIVGVGEAITLLNQDLFANYKPINPVHTETKNDIAAMFGSKGSLLTFFAIFLIGLALNLTPCVYPMLSVTVSLFGSQAETKFLYVFSKALIYVLGIATMYSVLGVMAALGGGLFGSWLQNPWILGSIAALLFALALSSFGLYQIQMPFWLTSKLGGTSGSGFITIYLSGLVVGVFAAPCVGPPVIALLTFVAAKGSASFGFWIFFTLALGLGFPYLILGTFSGLLKKIPRSGSWLVWVEHIFGVILIGAALFYLSLAVAPKLVIYVIPFTLAVGGIYLGFIDKSGKDKLTLKRIQWVFGIITVVAGLLFANNLRNESMTWEAYSDANLLKAKVSRVPIIIDFYADWCIPCLELDRDTWTDEEVIHATKDIKKIKVDLTHFDSPESEALRKKFNISGVPTVIFIRTDGTEASESRIIGFIPAKEFLIKLKQIL
jgi:thiol:disulfide interchange protein DsbD